MAADRAARRAELVGDNAERGRYRSLADTIHADVMAKGFDSDRNTFVQAYGTKALDASLLQIPIVGFLPGDDSRVAGTIDAIKQELVQDGFVARYLTDDAASDGLAGTEGRS